MTSMASRVLQGLGALPLGPRGAYETVCEQLYLPIVDARRGAKYVAARDEAFRNEHLSRSDLDEVVDRKVQRVVTFAAETCSFYRERFRAAGLDPASIRTGADLAHLPLVTKQDVAEHGTAMESTTYSGHVALGVTSGSTGTPLRFMQSGEHEGWIEACYERGVGWWGLRRGDRRLVIWGRPVVGGRRAQATTWLKHRLRNAVSFNSFEEQDDAFCERVVRTLETFRPRLVWGYGSSIGRIAEYLNSVGTTIDEHARPRLVIYTGDHMYESERQLGERLLGAPVVSLYGSSEAGATAYACKEGALHVSEDHIHVEILREDGSPAAADELGEIVVTTLNNLAMPLIRYRLGDLGSFGDPARVCPCGVTLRTMNLEVGKLADRITTSTKKNVSPYALDYINKQLLRDGIVGMRHFLVEQTERDAFVLHVVRAEPYDARSVEFFIAKMTEYFGASIRTTVRFTDAIPISKSGKRRWYQNSMATSQQA